jgi:Uma2 family endonuclease
MLPHAQRQAYQNSGKFGNKPLPSCGWPWVAAMTLQPQCDSLHPMNEVFLNPPERPTTQAADGLPRWAWTVAEMERLAAAGFFHPDQRIELLGGEIVPMSPTGRRHDIIRIELTYRLARLAPENILVASEPQFNLGPDTYVVPDLLVCPRAIAAYDLRGADALLVVEVAESSLACDIRTKVPLYASHGVPEYWVINAKTLMTTMHREPKGSSYSYVRELSPDTQLAPLLVPSLAIALNAIALD